MHLQHGNAQLLFVTGFPTIDTVCPAIAVGVKRVIAEPAGSGFEHHLVKPILPEALQQVLA